MLGVVDPEEIAETWLAVQNTGTETLTLERIETSCPCIRVGDVPVLLEPGEAVQLKVSFNSADDPDFEGGLSVLVVGYLADGRIGCQTRVEVEVSALGE